MDDGVVLEPLVGNRVFYSLARLDHTMVQVWGPEEVNVAKIARQHSTSLGSLYGFRHIVGLTARAKAHEGEIPPDRSGPSER